MLKKRTDIASHRIHLSRRPPSKAAQNATTHTTLHSRRERHRRRRRRREEKGEGEMILVAIVAELLEEYTAAVARAMELLLSRAPPRIFSSRVRFLDRPPEPPLRLAAAVPALSPAALHRRRHPLIDRSIHDGSTYVRQPTKTVRWLKLSRLRLVN